MADDNTRFDIGALHALAGEKVFARGAEYSRGRLLLRSGSPRPCDLSDETPNAAKTF
jgi:hypothetical protein